jgi:hypothetical protein
MDQGAARARRTAPARGSSFVNNHSPVAASTKVTVFAGLPATSGRHQGRYAMAYGHP